jgi:uncharacterized protein YndB with AHSA1/START domain
VVYAALVDGDHVARWRVPDGMTSEVHEFDAREGGRFRISLTHESDSGLGKSSAHTDTYSGHFARLMPDELVVEVMEFETDDPALRGEMTMTTRITPVAGGVRVEIVHEGMPDAVPPSDDETGTRMALDRLARLVE